MRRVLMANRWKFKVVAEESTSEELEVKLVPHYLHEFRLANSHIA